MGRHEKVEPEGPRRVPKKWKQGDTFENNSGGWRGSIVAVESTTAVVRYWGEGDKLFTVNLDDIKLPFYRKGT
jgi:hypothetical protein